MKKLTLIALLILTLTLVGCNKDRNQTEPGLTTPPATEEAEDNQDEASNLETDSVAEEALAESDREASEIAEQAEASQSDDSQLNEIVATGKVSSCDKLQTESIKTICKDRIYLKLAIENEDKSQCNNITDEETKEGCKADF